MRELASVLMLVGVVLASQSLTKYEFQGFQNIFPKDDTIYAALDVGNVTADVEDATQKCANYCSVHGWCGAFYLSSPDESDGGKCRMIPNDQTNNTENKALGRIGHVYYYKNMIGSPITW